MIHREAVLHIPLSQYAYAPSERELTIRLRAARNNLIACTLYYGDRAQNTDPVKFTPASLKVVAYDELFDYFEVTFTPGFTRVCYYFELAALGETVLYYADLFFTELASHRSEYYQYPYIRREEICDLPAWFKESVVYNIFPDSFVDKDSNLRDVRYCIELGGGAVSRAKLGGTLRSIVSNLEYIKNLEFNCIYLNPIFTAGEHHKYDLIDYFHIDPCFGTDADFAELVNTAHAMGMHVIIDGVFNHCGTNFFAFQDVIDKGMESQYADWFYALEYPVTIPKNGEPPRYSTFAYEAKMPKLNTSNPAVRDYFMEVCRYWIRNFHVDGWRLDVANEVDREFWRAFRYTAKAENPECVLIGEVWESAESWLRGDIFDSTMNYDFRKNSRDFFALSVIDAATFNTRVTQMLMRYPFSIVQGQLNLLDSHDVSRFLSLCGEDTCRLKLAVLFLATFPGVPNVFYGDELGFVGLDEQDFRQAMRWGCEGEITDYYRRVMALRRFPATIYGDFKVVCAKKGEFVYGFKRSTGKNEITVLLNAGKHPVSVGEYIYPRHTPFIQQGWNPGCIDGFGYVVWLE